MSHTDKAAMPRYSSDPMRASPGTPYGSPDPGDVPHRKIGPMELAIWLHHRVPRLQERWSEEIRARGLGQGTDVDRVVERFVCQLVSLLPSLVGPYREQIQPLWIRASELFGTMAAKRGLAAGEVIEEFQILRELVIRDLYRDPPLGGKVPLSLREILRLNRALDRGVTHASVGHTDALFFQFFEADGDSVTMSVAEVAEEAEAQLELIGREWQEILNDVSPTSKGRVREN